MSFILDALRKSEHERQRQTGPALVEVAGRPAEAEVERLGDGRHRAAGREPRRRRRAAAAASRATSRTAAAAATAARRGSPPQTAATRCAAAARRRRRRARRASPDAAAAGPGRAAADAAPGRGARRRRRAAIRSSARCRAGRAAHGTARRPRPRPATRRPVRAAVRRRRGAARCVYEPIARGRPLTRSRPRHPPAAAAARRNLPTADEVIARGGVPELHLDLHVYSSRAAGALHLRQLAQVPRGRHDRGGRDGRADHARRRRSELRAATASCCRATEAGGCAR